LVYSLVASITQVVSTVNRVLKLSKIVINHAIISYHPQGQGFQFGHQFGSFGYSRFG